MISFFKDENKRTIFFLALSLLALIISFFDIVSLYLPTFVSENELDAMRLSGADGESVKGLIGNAAENAKGLIGNASENAMMSSGDSPENTIVLADGFLNNILISISGLKIDIAWIAILLCGLPIIKDAIVGLATRFDIKADVLVSIALVASVVIGETFAAGEIAFIMMLGAYLEERTVAKARDGIEKLVKLTPTTARIVRKNKNGEDEEDIIAATKVCIGDTLRVLAGETIAVDGIITSGQTSIDQSVMTGESMPVDKGPGDEVLSGTVNQFGTFCMQAKKVGDDSSLQRMIRLVESADAGKAKIVTLADRWATWIVVFALASALITGFVTGEIIRAVTILVVFCPCALVLATPTAIMAGIGNATRYGILVSKGDALERLAKVTRIAFDKTGTLTYGHPSVIKVRSCSNKISEKDLLRITASAELYSEHPLGKAIVSHYRQTQAVSPLSPEEFLLIPGRGVSATVDNMKLFAGNAALIREVCEGVTIDASQTTNEITSVVTSEAANATAKEITNVVTSEAANAMSSKVTSEFASELTSANESGCTIIYIASKNELLGFIILSDTLRTDAASTISAIHDTGTKTVLLTGDAAQTATNIARLAGIADVKSGCLPEDKLSTIQSFQKQGEPVCMVGDGINDAPALKIAQVGIAMGGIGSDIAIEAADIVLVGDDIKTLPHLLLLAKKVMRTINVNLSASMLLNFIAIILAITGILNPVLGALVHNAGSVAVILNSSMLLKWKQKVKRSDN
ncbi:MAG: cation-translocating P-type ATPase [Coriobacteriales bacterium]|jgi:heavy metal translocating P-type ATPase|nr:cation-translocating P-type ATPase [Coriobacteriales bacterium]